MHVIRGGRNPLTQYRIGSAWRFLASVQTKFLSCIRCKTCSDANCRGTGFRTSREIVTSHQGQHVIHLVGTEGVVGLVQRALPGSEGLAFRGFWNSG